MILPIKKKWFDMIKSGEKKEEYREIKPYYVTRFQNVFGAVVMPRSVLSGDMTPILLQGNNVCSEIRKAAVQQVIFRNGYGSSDPAIVAECRLRIGEGKTEWGAEPGQLYFVLDIIKLLDING